MKTSYQLHKKLRNIKPYEVIQDSCRIRLDANESFIDPGEVLQKQIWNAIKDIPFNRYPDDACTDLRKAFADHYGVLPEQVVFWK